MIRITPLTARSLSLRLSFAAATQGGMGRTAEIESRPNCERFVQSSYSSPLLDDGHEPRRGSRPSRRWGSGAQQLGSEAAMMRNVKVLEREARARGARQR